MKTVRNLIVLALLALVLLGTCSNGTTEDRSEDDDPDAFVGGTGTPSTLWYTANPGAANFTISNADELAGLAKLVNDGTELFYAKTITLAVNLNLSAYSGGQGWTPIGRDITKPFSGTFDGQGKIISGLFINTDEDYAGLFGFIDSAEIRNLGIINADISAQKGVGILVSGATSSIISNCYATGNVSGFQFTGGLIGLIALSTVTNCHAEAKVSGLAVPPGESLFIGGLVGAAEGGTIINCYATGAVNGDRYVGGLVGYGVLSVNINNCYATGALDGRGGLDGTGYAGGLAGAFEGGNINNCYATGAVRSTDNAGGLVGAITGSSTMKYCFALNLGIDRRLLIIFGNNFGKVAGLYDSGMEEMLSANFAYAMNLPTPMPVLLGHHGFPLPVTKNMTKNPNTYSALWSFGNDDDNPWKMGNDAYPLPVLYWQDEASYPVLPEHLK